MDAFYISFHILWVLVKIALVLFVVAVIMMKPRKKRDTSYFHTKMYAHRGLHGNGVPENSMTAFKLAVEKGYGVELDVQMTKDKQLVVFHDGNLKRVCGVDGFVKDYTYEELKQFRLCDTEERIPLFYDVLMALKDTDLICEIKGDNGNKCYELCEKTYYSLLNYKGRFCIESFSPYLVKWFRKKHPEIIRGQLSCDFMSDRNVNWFVRFTMTHLLVNCVSKPDFIAYKHQDTGKLGYRLCRLIYRPFMIAWTAKGVKEQESAWSEFDSVIFEMNEE